MNLHIWDSVVNVKCLDNTRSKSYNVYKRGVTGVSGNVTETSTDPSPGEKGKCPGPAASMRPPNMELDLRVSEGKAICTDTARSGIYFGKKCRAAEVSRDTTKASLTLATGEKEKRPVFAASMRPFKMKLRDKKGKIKHYDKARTENFGVKTHRAARVPGENMKPSTTRFTCKKEKWPGPSMGNDRGQLVPYHGEPETNGLDQYFAVSKLSVDLGPPPKYAKSTENVRVLPSVGTYTAQCTVCLKWRLIPTREKFEEIRANSEISPFTCGFVSSWRTGVSCEDPDDITPDNGRLWAIDLAGIPQTPLGWKRELRIRGEGCSKFADVYYYSPKGQRLRSMVEVENYLQEHREYKKAGIDITQFSFRTPMPLREDYVRKKHHYVKKNPSSLSPLELANVSPLAWESPEHRSNFDDCDQLLSSFMPPKKKRTSKVIGEDKRPL